MDNSKSFNITISDFSFAVLMPGFFFYHTALGIGIISPFLGGYFSPISLILLPFLIFRYLSEAKKNIHYASKVDLVFFSFILYFFFIVTINFVFGANQLIGLAEENIKDMVHLIDIFLIFRLSEFNSRGIKLISIICLIFMTAIIYSYQHDGFFYIKDQGQAINSEKIATYQGFARSYFFTFLVIAPFIKSLSLRLVLYFIGGSALFINGARTEFSALLFIIFLIEIFYAKYKLATFMIALIIIITVLFNANSIIAHLPNNRALELFNLSKSTSWESRENLTFLSLKTISENPILGDYGSYILIGGPGTYAHNILSAWVDLGLFGFIFVIAMMVFPIYFLCIDIIFKKNKLDSEKWILPFSLMIVTLLLLFTSKTHPDMLIGAALGAYAKYRYGERT